MQPSTVNPAELVRRAELVSPGGVHGAGRHSGRTPLYFKRAEAQYLWDIEGRQYLDLHGAYGTSALGYNDPVVRSAVMEVLEHEGVHFGAPHPREVELSETLVQEIPCADLVALCGGGGSDPLYFGLRVARSKTGRHRLLKFEGMYHGWHDPLAVSVRPAPDVAGPLESPHAVPVSSGSTEGRDTTVVGILNDREHLERLFARWGPELACAIIEPVCHSSGCILVEREFLQCLRDLCSQYGVILMFDEIITGFRHSVQGAQSLLGVTPDLAAFGKAMGNGFPISVLVGRRDVMSELFPLGRAYYTGTYNAHLVSVAAAQATIRELQRRDVHAHTFALGAYVQTQLNRAAAEDDTLASCYSFGSVFCLYLGVQQVRHYRDIAHMAHSKDFHLNRQFHEALLHANIYMLPFFANRCFLSAAHTHDDVDRVLDVIVEFMRSHREEINAAVRDPY